MAADCSELATILYSLAKIHAQASGVSTVDDLLAVMQKAQPDLNLDRQQLVGAIVEASTAAAKSRKRAKTAMQQIRSEAKNDVQLRAAIDNVEQALAEGRLPDTKQAPKSEAPEAIVSLRERLKELRAAVAKSEPAIKARVEAQIEKLTKELESTDFAVPVAEEEVPASPEVQRLMYERDKLRSQLNQRIRDAKPKNFVEGAVVASQFAKGFKASYDLPPVFRQGLFAIGHPQMLAESFVHGLKAIKSDQYAYQLNNSIKADDAYPVAIASGVRLNDIDAKLAPNDEAFLNTIANTVRDKGSAGFLREGLNKIAQGAEAGSRGYTAMMNSLRFNLFKHWSRTMSETGIPNAREAKAIAGIANMMTGDANLGQAERIAPYLNALFFSPRNMVSRMQLAVAPFTALAGEIADATGLSKQGTLNFKVPIVGTNMSIDVSNIGGGKRIRRALMGEYARVMAGIMSFYMMAQLMWGDDENFEVVTDPLDTQAGAIRVGNTYIDPLGGIRPLLVLAGRTISGHTTTSKGERIDIAGPDRDFASDTPSQLLLKFFRGKMAPVPGVAMDWLDRQRIDGTEPTFLASVGDLTIPMSPQDMIDVYREHGLVGGSAISALILTGMGTQTYAPKPQK